MMRVDSYSDAADMHKSEIRTEREKIMRPITAAVQSVVEFLVHGVDRQGADTSAVTDMERGAAAFAATGADFLSVVSWIISADARYRVLGTVPLFDPEHAPFPRRVPKHERVAAIVAEIASAFATLSLYTGSVSVNAFTLAYMYGGRRTDWLLEPMRSLAEIFPSEEYTMRALSTWRGRRIVSRDITTALRVLPKAMHAAVGDNRWPIKLAH
jgi:hypothetical protein